MYATEEGHFNHSKKTDFSAISDAAASFSDIDIYGTKPSSGVLDMVSIFGEYSLHETI